MLVILLAVVLVVMLLLCCCHCLCCLCCRVANATAAALSTLLPPPPSVGVEDDACYTNANSSLATLAHSICQALNACALFDPPLPAGCVGGKGGNNDGATGSSGRSWIVHRIGMVLSPPPPSGGTTATRVAGK
jgi:hypothetical protein